MSEKSLEPSQKQTKRDPDLVAAEIAMKRAAIKARQRAKQVGAGVTVFKDGNIVEERLNSHGSE
jgi:hypothetical protein